MVRVPPYGGLNPAGLALLEYQGQDQALAKVGPIRQRHAPGARDGADASAIWVIAPLRERRCRLPRYGGRRASRLGERRPERREESCGVDVVEEPHHLVVSKLPNVSEADAKRCPRVPRHTPYPPEYQDASVTGLILVNLDRNALDVLAHLAEEAEHLRGPRYNPPQGSVSGCPHSTDSSSSLRTVSASRVVNAA